MFLHCTTILVVDIIFLFLEIYEPEEKIKSIESTMDDEMTSIWISNLYNKQSEDDDIVPDVRDMRY